jgi:hypothetical protein
VAEAERWAAVPRQRDVCHSEMDGRGRDMGCRAEAERWVALAVPRQRDGWLRQRDGWLRQRDGWLCRGREMGGTVCAEAERWVAEAERWVAVAERWVAEADGWVSQ